MTTRNRRSITLACNLMLIALIAIYWLPPAPLAAQTPNFGPNVLIFDPTMSISSIQSQIDNIYNSQKSSQFGTGRYALLFQPGSYSGLTVNIGYYTQVLGLDPTSPNNTLITGAVQSDAAWNGGNATINFWRGMENLAINPTGGDSPGTTVWATSQACPVRRVHVEGNMVLSWNGYASGGFISDSVVDGQINSSQQQQYLTRSSQMGSWTGANWNMVFVGDTGNPPTQWPSPGYTSVAQAPVVREKPFLTCSAGTWGVFVPSVRTNSQGSTWANNSQPGTLLPISQFYIAQASTDTSSTINAALASGKNLILTPGIYNLSAPIQVNNANTVVLGLGLATLEAPAGQAAMNVADVDGVIIAGLLFDAPATNAPVLLQIGPKGSSTSHSTNPTSLHDLFFRIGGYVLGKATESLEINSNNVIGDDFWIWRADHGNSGTVGWTTNTAANGLVVNGANATIYGLAVEHYQNYQTLWNGNGGQTYFYQSEAPYDVPNQSSWMDGTLKGFASYKVANTVTSHSAWGLGIYCNFTSDRRCILSDAIESPTTGMNFNDMLIWSWSGQIASIINGTGSGVTRDQKATLTSYQ